MVSQSSRHAVVSLRLVVAEWVHGSHERAGQWWEGGVLPSVAVAWGVKGGAEDGGGGVRGCVYATFQRGWGAGGGAVLS
ncbi:hypothetical protein GCM10009679_45330 [Saccharothrix algeriensis]